MEMSPERWRFTNQYLHEVFGREDPLLEQLRVEARDAGLPDISVTAEVGHMLSILVHLSGARRAIELGTLGGYSAIWIARALAPGARLLTLERNPRFADFAERQLARAQLGDRVEVRRGAALELLPGLRRELGDASVGFMFVDAEKVEYPAYFELLRPMLAPGGLLVADNVLGAGSWWIDDLADPSRQGADRLNRLAASDVELESSVIPLREGLLVARRRTERELAR